LGAIFFFSLFLLTMQMGGMKNIAQKIEKSLLFTFNPFQRFTHWGGEKISRAGRYFQNVKKLENENAELRNKNSQLKEKLLDLEETQLENLRLNQLLAFKEEKPRRYIAAEVIGRDPTNWFKSITIDKGSSQGLQRHQPVLTHHGLVGRVIETTPYTAKILTIIDTGSNVGAIVQRSRSSGVVAGEVGGGLIMKYLQPQEDVAVGDVVITSGLGGVFPKGLLIGQVKWVGKKPSPLFQEIEITPAVDFSHLEEVLVLVSPAYASEQ
jgi:rod shape-determining protein MreC